VTEKSCVYCEHYRATYLWGDRCAREGTEPGIRDLVDGVKRKAGIPRCADEREHDSETWDFCGASGLFFTPINRWRWWERWRRFSWTRGGTPELP